MPIFGNKKPPNDRDKNNKGKGDKQNQENTQSSKRQHPFTNKKGKSAWDPESPFGEITTIEELIALPVFKEASDLKGGGTYTAGARVPVWMERRFQRLVELRGTPYYIMSDAVRDALYLGLHVLNLRYRAEQDWAVEAQMVKAADSVNEITRIKEQFSTVNKGVTELLAHGEDRKAKEQLVQYILSASELEDVWKKGKIFEYIMGSHVTREVLDKCSANIRKTVLDGIEEKHALDNAPEEDEDMVDEKGADLGENKGSNKDNSGKQKRRNTL